MRKRCFLLLIFLLISVKITLGINKGVQPVNRILLPRIGFPAFIEPNSSFNVLVVGELKELRAFVKNDVSFHELEVQSFSYNSSENLTYLTLRAKNVSSGLYSLVLETDKGRMVEPNCVSVRESWNLPLTVFWISDTHYDNRKGQLHLASRFRMHIWTMNFFSPDFIVITGDVCNNPPERLFMGAYKELMELQHPIVLVPGNHDHSLKEDFFTKYLAPSNASLNIGPLHIISLDTGPGSLNGRLTRDQLEWLEKDLEGASEKRVKILLIHHPLFALLNTSEVNVEQIMETLLRHNVTIVLSGHMHESYVFEEPILMVTNPNSYGMGVGRARPGFRIFTITSSGDVEWLKVSYDPIYLEEFSIVVFQVNDGEAKGFSLYINNRLPLSLSGSYKVKLASNPIGVEGAVISQINRTRDGKYLVELKIDVRPEEAKLIKLWSDEDREPPYEVELKEEIVYGAGANIIWVNVTARDDVLGVKNVTLKYSTDNKTWEDVKLLRMNEALFIDRFQVSKGTPAVYYLVEAEDAEGRVKTRGGRIVIEEEIESEITKPFPKMIVLIIVIIAILSTLLVIITTKKRK